ncbi:maltose O-acetyltransferase [Lutibacter sp. Hel_I_33_5]|uniref:acyltransferase n=1 Tax=Lutibacter sp. Hel_I_33_5 TaxID=1566289 RepID=UPI0011A99944|nr:DapH/DapD/GlmU-related protein [Lutibacter sp. Hel_I_33_5]TVZ54865.1 maltose O-acetyltransferase [Lutibacter sp. Hel_I_33_5]
MKKIKLYIKKQIKSFLGIETTRMYVSKLIKRGLIIGNNFNIQKGVILDDTHCWLITIGNNVTLAPNVHILCHDASTKYHLNYTKISPVEIKDNVFIGASSIIMPGVTIGENVIVAANSVVTKNISSNKVVAGIPAKPICNTDEYIEKCKNEMEDNNKFDERYLLKNITSDKKTHMKSILYSSKNKNGYIV